MPSGGVHPFSCGPRPAAPSETAAEIAKLLAPPGRAGDAGYPPRAVLARPTLPWSCVSAVTEHFDVLPVTETFADQNRAAHDSGAAWFARPDTGVEHVGKASNEPVSGCVVVNVRDAEWWTSENGARQPSGSKCNFESQKFEFPQFGIRLHVLQPGEPNSLYHSESQQEAFLVLSGECRLLVEGVERLLRPWDFFHSPAGTEHIFVGAGDGPCVILMAGARSEDWRCSTRYRSSRRATARARRRRRPT